MLVYQANDFERLENADLTPCQVHERHQHHPTCRRRNVAVFGPGIASMYAPWWIAESNRTLAFEPRNRDTSHRTSDILELAKVQATKGEPVSVEVERSDASGLQRVPSLSVLHAPLERPIYGIALTPSRTTSTTWSPMGSRELTANDGWT